jgi:hypothetical protein
MEKSAKSEMEENLRECGLYNAMEQKKSYTMEKTITRQQPNITVNSITVRRPIKPDNLRWIYIPFGFVMWHENFDQK